MRHFANFFLLIAFLGQCIDNSLQAQVRCPVVRLQNGRVRARARGRVVRFSCFDGYTLVGNRYSTCVRGEWDTPTPVCVNAQCPQLATPEHAVVGPKYNGAILIYFCEPGYSLIGPAEIYCDGRQWNGTAPHCRDTTVPPPTKCDFEKPDLCWWEQDPQHDFDWRRHNFETPSSHIGTGPTHDHTLGPNNDGYYLYIEASGRLVNDTARIISPIYNSSLTDSGCFSFWYHMYGATVGSLRVYFKSEVEPPTLSLMFKADGDQGNKWLHGIFDLPKTDKNFQIIIEGVRGSSYVSDIAVDDVAVLQGDECTASKAVKNNVTEDDRDEIELINSLQSCRGRCNNSTEAAVTILPPSSPDACQCTVDCADNSTCCPDYAEYCVLAFTDDTITTYSTARTVGTRPPTVQGFPLHPNEQSDSKETESTTSLSNPNHNVIPMNPKDDIDPNGTKPPGTKDFTTVKPRTTGKRMTTKAVTRTRIIVPGETTERISMRETPYAPITAATKLTKQEDIAPRAAVGIQDTQKFHLGNGKIGVAGIVSVVVCGLAATVIAMTIASVVVKRRKTYKRGNNGSALSEDSDVRFLTSDEILDFNLARPGDHEEP